MNLVTLNKRLERIENSLPTFLDINSLSITEVMRANPGLNETEAKEYIESLKEVEPDFRDFIIKCNKEPIQFIGWNN